MSIKCQDRHSSNRLYKEEEDKYRTPFQRDRDRIIHSGAFRKLEYKTQVFINHEGDYYRTRLTHSLEVAQITRAICWRLNLNESLGEAIALAHDFGHTPFGHAGEEALNECTKKHYGFNHNAQSLRILTHLEQRYASFNGMNLTWEVLEGIAKHNGPMAEEKQHRTIYEYNKIHDLRLDTFPSAEAQAASIADDIAYNAHDMDDGVRSQLIQLNDIHNIEYLDRILHTIESKHSNIKPGQLVHEFSSQLITNMVNDVVNTTNDNIKKLDIKHYNEIQDLNTKLIHFSQEFSPIHNEIKIFLMKKLYRHHKINRLKNKAKKTVKELFEYFDTNQECLPKHWQNTINQATSTDQRVLIISDFIAGMTDRFATQEHKTLIGN